MHKTWLTFTFSSSQSSFGEKELALLHLRTVVSTAIVTTSARSAQVPTDTPTAMGNTGGSWAGSGSKGPVSPAIYTMSRDDTANVTLYLLLPHHGDSWLEMYTDEDYRNLLEAKTRRNDSWSLATHISRDSCACASSRAAMDYKSHCEEQDNAAQMLHLKSKRVHNGSDAIYLVVVLLRTP